MSAITGEIYSVSQLNREVKGLIESQFPLIWIEGEISNLARPASWHLYFSLKDTQSQVRCAMFRGKNSLLRFRPENGMQVLIFARVSLYEGRGEFQLIAERMEPAGEGALQLAFDQLKAKLDREGLFDPALKRAVPDYPTRVGIVTSATGAALRDILSVLRRRFPSLEVVIYPTLVQGEGAAKNITKMIRCANQRAECDVLIVSRGGGSLEDLWAFNEEVVARAIADSDLPIVSGVGHEIDFTIADFVADVRAPTPSAAAELISPDQLEMRQTLSSYQNWFFDQTQRRLTDLAQRVDWLEKRLISPQQRLDTLSERSKNLQHRLRQQIQQTLLRRHSELAQATSRLREHNPSRVIAAHQATTQHYQQRLAYAMQHRLSEDKARFAQSARALNTVSPLATLDRGYAIVSSETQAVISDQASVQAGDRVTARLAHGELVCDVIETRSKPETK